MDIKVFVDVCLVKPYIGNLVKQNRLINHLNYTKPHKNLMTFPKIESICTFSSQQSLIQLRLNGPTSAIKNWARFIKIKNWVLFIKIKNWALFIKIKTKMGTGPQNPCFLNRSKVSQISFQAHHDMSPACSGWGLQRLCSIISLLPEILI